MIYIELFWSFFQIGLFSIGGGYAALPLMQKQVVDIHGWMTAGEFVDIVTISQMTPGAIAINAATFTGQRICGPAGSLIATLGCVLPSCIILMIITYFYQKYKKLSAVEGVLSGLRPAVASLIASSGIIILLTSLFGAGFTSIFSIDITKADIFAAVIFVSGFVILRRFKVSPIIVMAGSGLIGFLLYFII